MKQVSTGDSLSVSMSFMELSLISMLVSFKGTLHFPHLSSEPNEKLDNKYSGGSQNIIMIKTGLKNVVHIC